MILLSCRWALFCVTGYFSSGVVVIVDGVHFLSGALIINIGAVQISADQFLGQHVARHLGAQRDDVAVIAEAGALCGINIVDVGGSDALHLV